VIEVSNLYLSQMEERRIDEVMKETDEMSGHVSIAKALLT